MILRERQQLREIMSEHKKSYVKDTVLMADSGGKLKEHLGKVVKESKKKLLPARRQ